jgi:murein DD-endopeptidase MepM/ murein hydrolase activator NlpD
MTNSTTPLSSVSNLSSSGNIPSKTTSSTSEIISSFKEIMSVMTTMNGLSSNTASPYQSGGMGMNMSDLMAPLMLLMLERLIEQQLENETPTATTEEVASAASGLLSAGAAFGSKPEPSGLPVQGRITQEPHAGHMAFDIGVPVGTPIKTTMDGTVIHAGWNDQGYGNLVIVENGDYRTYYAHLSSIPVSVGDAVAAGSVIGLSGNTGHSTGPHLHYEIRKNKVAIDPTAATMG